MPATKTKTRVRICQIRPRKQETWKLRLYVAGQSPKSIRALANLKIVCEQHLKGHYQIEVIDILENPQMARGDQIVAVPTLIRKLVQPVRQIIGDLSNTDRVLVGLALQEVDRSGSGRPA